MQLSTYLKNINEWTYKTKHTRIPLSPLTFLPFVDSKPSHPEKRTRFVSRLHARLKWYIYIFYNVFTFSVRRMKTELWGADWQSQATRRNTSGKNSTDRRRVSWCQSQTNTPHHGSTRREWERFRAGKRTWPAFLLNHEHTTAKT